MCGTLCIYGVIGSGDTPGSTDERDNSFGDLLDFHQSFDLSVAWVFQASKARAAIYSHKYCCSVEFGYGE